MAITRAFGDFNLKSKGVIVEPFIKRLKIPKDSILVMASDGIWDVIDDQVILHIYNRNVLNCVRN